MENKNIKKKRRKKNWRKTFIDYNYLAEKCRGNSYSYFLSSPYWVAIRKRL